MQNTTAYHAGFIIGMILGVAFLIGACVFFVVALVKAIRTRRQGWVIAAVISGIPFVLLCVAFQVGFVKGLRSGYSRSRETAAGRRGGTSALLNDPMSPLSGNAMAYEISLPSVDTWNKDTSRVPFDYVFLRQDACLGIIAENIGLGTPERICKISQQNLAKNASAWTATRPVAILIDSNSWRTFDADATIKDIKFKYRFYVYADSDHTIQIVAWTGPVVFDQYAPVFDRIAKSFKLPKPNQPPRK